MLLGLAAMAVAVFGAFSLVLLALSAVLLDFAVQGTNVLSVRDIYALRPEARARINSVYMTSVFVGGAISSALTGVIQAHWGWTGVAILAMAMVAVSGLVWLADLRAARRPVGADAVPDATAPAA